MFKKFVSNALLSVAFDKKARNKIKTIIERKRPVKFRDSETDKVSPQSVSDNPSDVSNLKDSPLKAVSLNQHPPEQAGDLNELKEELLNSAKQELERKSKKTSEKEPIPLERAALIEQAMAIRRSKLHILNELDRDQLDKLTELAIRALNLRIQK